MLKLGEKIISDIYLGDKKIAKVFLGDKLVYQANKPIFLEYIDSDGNNCIDSGIECTSDLKIEFKGSCPDNANQACCGGIGLENAPIYFRYHWTPAGGMFGFWCQNDANIASINGSHPMGKVVEATIDAPNGIAIVNGVEYTFTKLEKGLTTGKNFGVFGRISSKGDIQSKPSRFYYFRIYKNDILMRDLRPCIDPNGVVCMYDMVTKKYHYNIGTGTLTAGNVIKFVDYIESDGNSYIDTGIVLSSNHKVSIRAMVTVANPSAVVQLFGNYSDPAGAFTCNIGNNVGAISRFDGVSFTGKNLYKSDSKFHTYTVDKKGIIVDTDSILSWSGTPTDFQQSESFYLFCARGSTSRTANGTQISEEKVWENDTLIQHLKPCVVAGEACFYDMVTGNVFTNAGTGTLKASGRFVESIVFDGASWIDTGINKQSCTIECTVKLESTDYRQFLGGWSHIGGYYIAVDTSNRFELGSSAIATGSNATELSNVVAEHTETEMILTVNGNYAKRTKQVQTEPDKNYWLGNINSTSYSAPIKGQVRGHKFKNADGILIQDLRPYVDENGTACFKDIVTGKLFYNQGTGKLEYTE